MIWPSLPCFVAVLPQLTPEQLEQGRFKKPERLVIPSVYIDSSLTADETVGNLAVHSDWSGCC